MSVAEMRGVSLPIDEHWNDALTLTFVFLDAAGDAYSPMPTITANVWYKSAVAQAMTVTGAANTRVVSLTAAQMTALNTKRNLTWSLVADDGSSSTVIAGVFQLSPPGRGVGAQSGNEFTVTMDTTVTITLTGTTGPIGPGLPAGGTTGQLAAKASNTDYDVEWIDPSASGGLSNVVEDTTPQLGGDLDPNGHAITGYQTTAQAAAAYDAIGSAAAAQSAAEATAAAALSSHEGDTTSVHGIADTSALLDSSDIGSSVQAYAAVLDATTAAFTTADETKLDGIETAATADQTGAEIKAAYEAEADTNAYDDAAVSKLAGIEAAADVTDAANVAAAGAHMAGGTDVPVTDGGTGASDAATALSNLGGQPVDSDLTAIAALTTTAYGRALLELANIAALQAVIGPTGTPSSSTYLRGDGSWDTPGGSGDLVAANNLSDVANAATSLSNLGGQPLDSDLTAIAALTTTTYGRGLLGLANQAALQAAVNVEDGATADQSAAEILAALLTVDGAGSGLDADLLDGISSAGFHQTGGTDVPVTDGGTGASTAAGARTNLGLVIGTDVQAQDAELAAIAGLVSAANKVPYFTGSGAAALADLTAFARTLLDDADAATALVTLGATARAQAINAQTGTTYTLVAGDAGKLVTMSNASPPTLTVPQDSAATIAVGEYVDITQLGAGQLTVAAGAGATLRVSGLTAKARAQYSRLMVQKISANTWQLAGDLAAS